MNLRLPQYIKIGVHSYLLLYPYKFKERNDFYGQIDYDLQEIRLCGVDTNGFDRPFTETLVALLHEIIHGIDHVYFAGKMCEVNDKEKLTEILAQGLAQVLEDNGLLKQLIQYEPIEEKL